MLKTSLRYDHGVRPGPENPLDQQIASGAGSGRGAGTASRGSVRALGLGARREMTKADTPFGPPLSPVACLESLQTLTGTLDLVSKHDRVRS